MPVMCRAGDMLVMGAGDAARGGERLAPLPITPLPAAYHPSPMPRYPPTQGVVLLEEGNVRTVETGALQK